MLNQVVHVLDLFLIIRQLLDFVDQCLCRGLGGTVVIDLPLLVLSHDFKVPFIW